MTQVTQVGCRQMDLRQIEWFLDIVIAYWNVAASMLGDVRIVLQSHRLGLLGHVVIFNSRVVESRILAISRLQGWTLPRHWCRPRLPCSHLPLSGPVGHRSFSHRNVQIDFAKNWDNWTAVVAHLTD